MKSLRATSNQTAVKRPKPQGQSPARLRRTQLVQDLAALADADKAGHVAKFFKTGPGEYGEGDKFLGLSVPIQRKIALRYHALPLRDLAQLLASPTHEHRFAALEILVDRYKRAAAKDREAIVAFYLRHSSRVNNWDLVDTSAPYILGEHFRTRSRRPLVRLAKSKSIWERRIAIVSTLTLIKNGEIDETFRIARQLLADQHDLIHKAVGWALREAGKVSESQLLEFLELHYASLPRTTLRYAIERFPAPQRKRLLAGKF